MQELSMIEFSMFEKNSALSSSCDDVVIVIGNLKNFKARFLRLYIL